MQKTNVTICALFMGTLFAACGEGGKKHTPPAADSSSFAADVAFLKQHVEDAVILQRAGDSASVFVTGDYQARVMTSTATGANGRSFGWINRDLVASGKYNPHINAYGGEERFWLGPEGGQYALYFAPGKPFNFDNWQTPGLIDTARYQRTQQSDTAVTYTKSGTLQNYAGAAFNIGITRTIRLVNRETLGRRLGQALPAGLQVVAYETENSIANEGKSAWSEKTGLPSIWLLGMFVPSDKTVIAVPFKPGPDARRYITDDYFGKIPENYLLVKDSVLLMRADGKRRGKIGLSPRVALPLSGSVDLETGAITLILFSVDPEGRYVNSKWEQQQEPYKGDVANCYNDGPLADGSQMGPFYELESSSPVKPLQPGESLVYKQITAHIEGDRNAMDQLAQQIWHMSLAEIAQSLNIK